MAVFNVLIFGGSGYVAASDSNAAANVVLRDANGNTLQTGVIAGNSVPASVPAGAICFVNMGSSFQNYRTISASGVTLTASDPKLILVDCTSLAFAVGLPPIGVSDKLEFDIFKADGIHNATITGNASDNIQVGATSANTSVMSTAGSVLRIRAAGGVWRAV